MIADLDPIILAERFCEMERHASQDIAENSLKSQTQNHGQDGGRGKERCDIDPESAVQYQEQDAQIKNRHDQTVEHFGKRVFPAPMHMPTDEDSIHEPDQKDDEKEYERCIEKNMKLFRWKKGLADGIDLKNERDDQKNERQIQS